MVIHNPFWLHSGEKGVFAISKGCESNCATPWLSEWLVLWSGTLKASSTKGMASCGVTPEAAQGRLRPWGLRACDKCSLKHYGLVWSGPNMSWGCKSGQGPDGPPSEWIPSKLPKPQFAERGREHSSWYLFWGQEHKRGGGRHLFDGSLTPWSGPEWANHPGNWVHACPVASMGPGQHPCILWTSSAPKPGQREELCPDYPYFWSPVTNQSPTRIWVIIVFSVNILNFPL